ncbi:MAG: hypothetical protein GY797_39600, partial [Deltaproteobacteria bacterium]|nr:hypothetical protein [Deltaproteobacteria bacterium]
EATRADQARADAEHEADRAKDAEEEAEDERATAEAESTRALIAEQTAQAEQAAAETAQAEEARARQTAEAGATQEAIARATATAAVATAQAASEFATSRQLAARALTLQETQYDLSLLLSLESNRIADTVEAKHSLLDALTTNPELAVFLHTHTNGVQSAVFSPDGNTLASASDDQTIILWDTSTRYDPQPLGQPLTGHTNKIRGLAFSPDGNLLASGSDDCTLILW